MVCRTSGRVLTAPDNNVRHVSGYTMLEMYLDYAMHNKLPMDDGYVEPQGITNPSLHGGNKGRLIIRDGQVLIQRNGKLYTLTGMVLDSSRPEGKNK